jgi:hypothetical protein
MGAISERLVAKVAALTENGKMRNDRGQLESSRWGGGCIRMPRGLFILDGGGVATRGELR